MKPLSAAEMSGPHTVLNTCSGVGGTAAGAAAYLRLGSTLAQDAVITILVVGLGIIDLAEALSV